MTKLFALKNLFFSRSYRSFSSDFFCNHSKVLLIIVLFNFSQIRTTDPHRVPSNSGKSLEPRQLAGKLLHETHVIILYASYPLTSLSASLIATRGCTYERAHLQRDVENKSKKKTNNLERKQRYNRNWFPRVEPNSLAAYFFLVIMVFSIRFFVSSIKFRCFIFFCR